jgi:hypothetical protein
MLFHKVIKLIKNLYEIVVLITICFVAQAQNTIVLDQPEYLTIFKSYTLWNQNLIFLYFPIEYRLFKIGKILNLIFCDSKRSISCVD